MVSSHVPAVCVLEFVSVHHCHIYSQQHHSNTGSSPGEVI